MPFFAKGAAATFETKNALTTFTPEELLEAQRILGYDPKIQIIPETRQAIIPSQSGTKTIYCHGLGGSGQKAAQRKQFYPSFAPGDLIVFNFPEVIDSGYNPSHASIGQWPDIKVLLHILNLMRGRGETAIGIRGFSRGGAVVINSIAILQDDKNLYDKQLGDMGIDQGKRLAIINMIKNGHLVIECPITTVPAAIQQIIETKAAEISLDPDACTCYASCLNFLGGGCCAECLNCTVVPLVVAKEYNPFGECALDLSKKWNGFETPTLLRYVGQDDVVGDKHEDALFKNLQASNGASCTFLHKDLENSKHNSSSLSFKKAHNNFLKRNGAAFDPGSLEHETKQPTRF